jgi:hypothetical protein
MERGSGPLPKAPQRDGIPGLDNVAFTARTDRPSAPAGGRDEARVEWATLGAKPHTQGGAS